MIHLSSLVGGEMINFEIYIGTIFIILKTIVNAKILSKLSSIVGKLSQMA